MKSVDKRELEVMNLRLKSKGSLHQDLERRALLFIRVLKAIGRL